MLGAIIADNNKFVAVGIVNEDRDFFCRDEMIKINTAAFMKFVHYINKFTYCNRFYIAHLKT